jgi:hypothetical protein
MDERLNHESKKGGLTGTIVVGVKEGKEGTDSKHIGVLVESHFDRLMVSRMKMRNGESDTCTRYIPLVWK